MLIKKAVSCILAASLLITLCSCRAEDIDSEIKETETQQTTTSIEETEATSTSPSEETEPTTTESLVQTGPVDGKTLEDKLYKLERVRSVEKMEVYPDDKEGRTSYKEKYVVFFDVPLDWNDPDKGSFPLRTIFTYVDDNASNTLLCDGYFIYFTDISGVDYRRDLTFFYNTNEVQVEHRFFGESVPEGLSIDSLDYWEYLTDENAAEDFHFVITQFKRILSGKWMFTGASKGGQLTHMQSYFHPEDADVFVSFVAPGGSDQDAPGFFDYIYNEIGDSAYGETKAKKYRDMVLQFQVEAIKNRDKLAQRYYDRGLEDGCIYSEFTTPDILYDMAVLEFATTTWQYFQDFSDIKSVLNNKGSKTQKHLDKILDMLYETNPANIWAHNSEYFAYYVQSAKQNGEHEYDFSFLREELAKDGSGAKLTVTEDMEKGLLFRMIFTPEQYKAFTFDPTLYNNMVRWSHETVSMVLMIYGKADVWYSVRLPDVTDNENIHIFTLPHASHMTSFERMDKEMATEVEELLDPILKWE